MRESCLIGGSAQLYVPPHLDVDHAWQRSHWSTSFEITGMTRPGMVGSISVLPEVVEREAHSHSPTRIHMYTRVWVCVRARAHTHTHTHTHSNRKIMRDEESCACLQMPKVCVADWASSFWEYDYLQTTRYTFTKPVAIISVFRTDPALCRVQLTLS